MGWKKGERELKRKKLKRSLCEQYLGDSDNWEIKENLKEHGLQIAHLKNTEISVLRVWQGTRPNYGDLMEPDSNSLRYCNGYGYVSARWYPLLFLIHWIDENGIDTSKICYDKECVVDELRNDRRWLEDYEETK